MLCCCLGEPILRKCSKQNKADFICCFMPHLYRKLLIYNYLHIPAICRFYFSFHWIVHHKEETGGGGLPYARDGDALREFSIKPWVKGYQSGLGSSFIWYLKVRTDVHFKRRLLKDTYTDITQTSFLFNLGVANGKCETLRDDEISVFLCEPETFWFLQLRDRDFKVFWMRTQDVQVLRCCDVI